MSTITRRSENDGLRTPWLALSSFLLPALLIYAAFTAYPVLRTFWNAFHKVLPNGSETWVGFANLHAILTNDATFWKAVGNTLAWALVAPILEVSLGLLLALALYARVPFARFFRVAWFTPVLISYVVVGILWMWIYN
jgi:ABC-type sugar transport system permease subunit